MQQTFLDIVYKIFYETAQRDFKDVRLLLSEKYFFTSIKFEPNIEVKIPIPKSTSNGIVFCGNLFNDSSEGLHAVWSMFLATLYHMAAHVAVSDYSLYDEWKKQKTPSIYWHVIDFIEDNSVERYLSSTNPDVWENISRIMEPQNNFEGKIWHKLNFSLKLASNLRNSIIYEMKNEPLQTTSIQRKHNILSWASKLYQSRLVLNKETPLFYESHDHHQNLLLKKNMKSILTHGKFESTVKKLNFLYLEEKNRIEGILYKIRKDLYGLNFDEIVSPNEDIYEFFNLKEKNKKIIKKIREQIRSVNNNSEDPQTNFYGEIDMELAIQAIASNTQRYAEVFNKTEEQRIEETWAILIDNSASLKLRFEDVKDFMLCLAEASDELTGPSGSWGLYGYDQKF